MTAFRINCAPRRIRQPFLLAAALAATLIYFNTTGFAQSPTIGADGRAASFMPLDAAAPIASSAPIVIAPATANPAPVGTSAAAPTVNPPVAITPQLSVPSLAASPPAPPSPSSPPAQNPVAPPVAISTTAPTVPTAPPPALDVTPVATTPLPAVSPDALGLITTEQGGLGANLWQGSSAVFIDFLLPTVNLPTNSATLNRLAQRLLTTIAAPPAGASAPSATAPAAAPANLTAIRIDRLIALGAVGDAWKLMTLAKPEQLDELTLQRLFESALVSDQADAACGALPDVMKSHSASEWQKILLVCQLRGKDVKAAQVTLDLLHSQNVKDEIFLTLIEKNLVGGSKQLPRQLTPLKPLNMALLRLIDLPLPAELYAHPDAHLIPALLAATPKDESARLALAERAAAHALIDSAALAARYRAVSFSPEQIKGAATSLESGAILRAQLYQAALQSKVPQERMGDAAKFMQNADAQLIIAAAPLLIDMIGAAKPGPDFYPYAPVVAEIYMLAGQPAAAQEWLALARRGAIGMPGVATALHAIWPIQVFAGFASTTDYAADRDAWIELALKPADPQQTDDKAGRERVLTILTLLDALGFAVPDEVWVKAVDAPDFERRPAPPTWLIERFRAAAAANRRGEMIMLGLLLNNNNLPDPTRFIVTEQAHALRVNGLTAEAAGVATAAALEALLPPAP